MPITLVTGPANSGKAEAVMDAVRGHVAHGEQPLLVVPTRADVEHYLRELAGERGGDGGARGALRGADRRDRETRRRQRARARRTGPRAGARSDRVTRGLRRGWRGLPRGARGLRRGAAGAACDPGPLAPGAGRLGRSDGTNASWSELGGLFASYRAELDRIGRLDGEQSAARALDALRERPALWGGTPVLFYGFDDLTVLQLDAIETLGRVVAAEVTVSLAYEPGRAAFAGRAASFQALAPLAGRAPQAAGARAALRSVLARSPRPPGALPVRA